MRSLQEKIANLNNRLDKFVPRYGGFSMRNSSMAEMAKFEKTRAAHLCKIMRDNPDDLTKLTEVYLEKHSAFPEPDDGKGPVSERALLSLLKRKYGFNEGCYIIINYDFLMHINVQTIEYAYETEEYVYFELPVIHYKDEKIHYEVYIYPKL